MPPPPPSIIWNTAMQGSAHQMQTPSGFGSGGLAQGPSALPALGRQAASGTGGSGQLDALGMDWTSRNDRKWMSLADVAAAYYHEHGSP